MLMVLFSGNKMETQMERMDLVDSLGGREWHQHTHTIR